MNGVIMLGNNDLERIKVRYQPADRWMTYEALVNYWALPTGR